LAAARCNLAYLHLTAEPARRKAGPVGRRDVVKISRLLAGNAQFQGLNARSNVVGSFSVKKGAVPCLALMPL